jgi:hypothetical protein
MERFFAPCDRYNEFYRQYNGHDIDDGQDGVDVDLIGDIEDVYAAGFTFSDLMKYVEYTNGRMMRVWISQRAFFTGVFPFVARYIRFKHVIFLAGDCDSMIVCAPEGDGFVSAWNISFRVLATSKMALHIMMCAKDNNDLCPC